MLWGTGPYASLRRAKARRMHSRNLQPRLFVALVAVALIAGQLASAASFHSHDAAPDVHERAWCDGSHESQAPEVDHDPQQCQACRQRDFESQAVASQVGPVPRVAGLRLRLGSTPAADRQRWPTGRAPARAPPAGS